MKKLLSFLLATLMISLTTVTAFAEDTNSENTEEETYSSSDNEEDYACGLVDIGYRPEVPVIDDTISWCPSYDEQYDPRIGNSTTKVKNQFSNNVSWAFAANAVLENEIYKETGLKEDLSEEAMRYVQSNYIETYLGHTSDLGSYLRNPYDGDTAMSAIEYLSHRNSAISDDLSWVSPNLTSDIPYVNNIINSNDLKNISNLKMPDNLDTSYSSHYATDIKYINFEDIKNRIYNKYIGGVFISIRINKDCVNNDTGAIYNPKNSGVGHAVEIVGWDDNYSKENFSESCQPKKDGAYLIKNSWGTDWGEDGFGWISYEDASLNTDGGCFAVDNVEPVSKNEYTLSYDYLPINGEISTDGDVIKHPITKDEPYVCMSNVYDVSELSDEYGEINKVTFYSNEIGATYRVYIVPLSGNNYNIPKISSLSSELAFGTVDYEGYKTVKLRNPYKFDASTEKLAVIVRFTIEYVSGCLNNNITLCRERLYSDLYSPIANKNESFLYCNGTWTDISEDETNNYGNYCIRPTLVRRNEITENSALSVNEVKNNGRDITVKLNLNGNLLCSIKRDSKYKLYEDVDFTRSGNTVTFKKSFLDSLSTNSASNIVFNFTDGDDQILTILPKSKIESVSVEGKTAITETLIAVIQSDADEIDYNDVTYQWQSSSDGKNWANISGAINRSYTLTKTDSLKYIRVVVSSKNSNYYQQTGDSISSATNTRAVSYGDAKADNSIGIDDVTEIQKIIAGLSNLTRENLIAGDLDCNGNLTIEDVTYLQKYLAGYFDSLPIR